MEVLEFGGVEIFIVKYLLYFKFIFMGISEKESILNVDEVEIFCVYQRNFVGLIDFLGKLFVSLNCCFFNQYLYYFLTFVNVGLYLFREVGFEVGQCFYFCVIKEENEIFKV